MRILQYVRAVPRRLPPRGKYRHSRRKVVSVMCHRFQNSVTEALRYGESKFTGRRMPKSRATPVAMSQ